MKLPGILSKLALSLVLPLLAQAGTVLVNPNATHETKVLMRYLDSVYGKKIISGQMDDAYLSYIKTTSGKEPAMMGYDFNGVCPTQNGNKDAAKAIKWVKERGGIAQFQWHWISPNGDGDYYTKNFNLANALADENSQAYKNILRDIDLAAAEMLKLQAAGVPILWRPLHEAEGAWFWWGMSGGDACKKLYRLMYDRLTKHHGLNNLIWVWTSYGTTKQNWYPGDDVVDMIVWDYPYYQANGGSWSQYQKLFGDKNKLFGIGEDGKLIDPELLATQGWLYFMTWAYMINDTSKNTPEWVNKVYNDARVITLSDVKIEDYDAKTPVPEVVTGSTSKMANLSVRSQTGDQASQFLIAGFVVSGSQSQTVLVRAAGPALLAFGVGDAISDPILEVYNSKGELVASNDDHRPEVTAIADKVGAFSFKAGSLDAALVLNLPAGAYSAMAKSRKGSGTVLVEAYEVD